jgi:hypothetical protein
MKFSTLNVFAMMMVSLLVTICGNSQTANSTNQAISSTDSRTTVQLDRDERAKVSRFCDKRKEYPGPSANDVRGAVEVLLLRSCGTNDVKTLIGDSSYPPKRETTATAREFWGYDVGDSQSFTLVFNSRGQVAAVMGTGVGFQHLECSADTNGVKRVVEKGK